MRRTSSPTRAAADENKLSRINTVMTSEKINTSILPFNKSRAIEIKGFYWPRVLLRNDATGSKGDEKKVIKAGRRRTLKRLKINTPYQQEATVVVSPPTFDLNYSSSDVPSLLSENQPPSPRQHQYSPVTGRRLLFTDKSCSRLIPVKDVRKSRYSVSKQPRSLYLMTSEWVMNDKAESLPWVQVAFALGRFEWESSTRSYQNPKFIMKCAVISNKVSGITVPSLLPLQLLWTTTEKIPKAVNYHRLEAVLSL